MLTPLLFLALTQTAPQAAPPRAQTPAPAARPAPRAPLPDDAFYASLRQQGLSEAGVRVMQASAARHAAAFDRANASLGAIARELAALAAAPALDVARFSDALRRRDTAKTQLDGLQTAAMIEALQAAAPADRAVILRVMGFEAAPTQRR